MCEQEEFNFFAIRCTRFSTFQTKVSFEHQQCEMSLKRGAFSTLVAPPPLPNAGKIYGYDKIFGWTNNLLQLTFNTLTISSNRSVFSPFASFSLSLNFTSGNPPVPFSPSFLAGTRYNKNILVTKPQKYRNELWANVKIYLFIDVF